jgi:hypothetical protein
MKEKAKKKVFDDNRSKKIPDALDVYISALNKLYRSDDIMAIFQSVMDFENSKIDKILKSPYSNTFSKDAIGAEMDFSHSAAFNAGMIQGLLFIQKFRHDSLKKYHELIKQTEESNESH